MTPREAIVLFRDQPVGRLRETAGGGTSFTYDEGWSEQIGCGLPATPREHNWPDGLHPFFQHLGPEGRLRERQARVAQVVEEDDFGLLLRYGADCIGAVSLRPADPEAGLPSITEAATNPGRTVSGVQRKLLVVAAGGAFRPAAAEGPAPFIAKFNSPELGDLVRNEQLSLSWTAAALGGDEVNAFRLGRVEVGDGSDIALVVTRFDRGPKGEKLRLEDFAQILRKPRGRDYGGKYDAAYEDVAAVIQRHSVRPTIDLARFFRRLVAFALVGNCDAHLKNFSLLETPEGLRLSPAYDVVNTALYKGYDHRLALSMGGRKMALDDANGPLFRDFGRRIGLSDRAVEQGFAELGRGVRKAAAVIRPPEAEPPDGFVNRFAEIVSNGCMRVFGG